MQRNIIWGCLGSAGLVVILLLVAFYFFVFRPTEAVMADMAQIAELSDQNEKLRDLSLFAPPVNGLLTSGQLDRFARVQASMRAGLGSDLPVLQERAEKLHGIRDNTTDSNRVLTMREAVVLFKGLGPVLTLAKTIQVEAMNREGFSQSEYRWVRERLYGSLGFSRTGIYIEDFEDEMNGETVDRQTDPGGEIEPGPNRDIAAPFSDSARDWFPFLVFGL
jgi:hypothetical protein